MAAATASAYQRATAPTPGKQWDETDASVQDQRALVAWMMLASAGLSQIPPIVEGQTVTISRLALSDRTDNQAWQRGLLNGLFVLLAPNPTTKFNLATSVKIETEDAAPPVTTSSTGDTGFPWLAAVAIVVAAAVLGSVLADWLSQQNEIQATKIATDANVQKHAATMATAADIVSKHVEREQAAGESLPWDPEELELLHTLEQSTITLAEWKAPELKTLPHADQSIGAAVASSIRSVGEGAKNAGAGIGVGVGVVLAGLAGLWFLEQSHERRAAA